MCSFLLFLNQLLTVKRIKNRVEGRILVGLFRFICDERLVYLTRSRVFGWMSKGFGCGRFLPCRLRKRNKERLRKGVGNTETVSCLYYRLSERHLKRTRVSNQKMKLLSKGVITTHIFRFLSVTELKSSGRNTTI